jgi:CheY-like chemotaxis protein
MLVVEDQHFSQKLLCEILRGVRTPNSNESPTIEVTEYIQDAWMMFVKNAPDITFIDLVLQDGSGHTLARAIKEVDPQSRVVIVTANSHEGEIEVARQNNVDSFITKPYNKKQILDCATNYIATIRSFQKKATYGKAH